VVDLSFQRIPCTPDLTPTDIIGTYVIMETPQGRRTFEFQKGPLFANIVLADQINRTTPKTQSAFLDAMDEDAVTVSTETFDLPTPYFVLATQNPLEMEGTYPLPEAQVDRFLLKLVMPPPTPAEMEEILARTTEDEPPITQSVADGRRVLEMGELVRKVPIAAEVRRWAVSVVAATHPGADRAPASVRKFVRHGAGPRAAQAMVLAGKIAAILAGRPGVSVEDLHAAALPALRHRVLPNFEGQAEEVEPDRLIQDVLEAVAPPGA
jgi:MoxR-like ATPase